MRFTPDTPADRKVIVTEVGTRDGFQAEPAFIPTATKAAILMALVDAGVASFEATSFVSPRAVPQMADAAELMRRVDRRAGVRLQALVPNAKGAQAAAAVRVDMMVCFLSASESHNQANLNKPIAASLDDVAEVAATAGAAGIPVRGAVATAFGCPFEGSRARSAGSAGARSLPVRRATSAPRTSCISCTRAGSRPASISSG